MQLKALYFEFFQETNSFSPIICQMHNFRNYKYCEDEAVLDVDREVRYETTGMIQAAEEEGIELIPSIAMWSQSTGPVSEQMVDHLLTKIRETYDRVAPVDGVFCVLHGSTEDTREGDCCGYVLEKVRELVGPDAVIASSFDLHGNLTPKILKLADVCCGYQTYPHNDAHEAAYRAGKLGARKLRDRNAFTTAAVRLPMMVPASGYTTNEGYFKEEVMDLGHRYVKEGKLLDFSVFQMQPWLDVADHGTTILAIGEDPAVAKECAQTLARKVFEGRDLYWPKLMSVDEVIDLALANEKPGPVILANSGDSPGAGAVGDSVYVLNRLIERNVPLKYATLVLDGDAVRKAFEVGVGNTAEFTFGASLSPTGQPPVKAMAKVCSLHEGYFRQEGPISVGLLQYCGPTAVLAIGTYEVVVCEYPANTGDPQIYRHFGIEPTLFDLVEVKANTSFRLPFSKFAAEICMTDVPGTVGTSNLLSLDFKNIGEGFYPFSKLDDYEIGEAILYG